MAGCSVYNGWSNYSTWLTALWVANEEPSYRYWREVADECRVQAEGVEGEAAALLADRLKQEHDDAAHERLGGRADVFTDLLSSTLADVAWLEMAEHILSE